MRFFACAALAAAFVLGTASAVRADGPLGLERDQVLQTLMEIGLVDANGHPIGGSVGWNTTLGVNATTGGHNPIISTGDGLVFGTGGTPQPNGIAWGPGLGFPTFGHLTGPPDVALQIYGHDDTVPNSLGSQDVQLFGGSGFSNDGSKTYFGAFVDVGGGAGTHPGLLQLVGGSPLNAANANAGSVTIGSGVSEGTGSGFVDIYTAAPGASGTSQNPSLRRVVVDGYGSTVLQFQGAVATVATSGMTSIATCAGPPTGTPGSPQQPTGTSTLVVDSADHTLNFNVAGTWYNTVRVVSSSANIGYVSGVASPATNGVFDVVESGTDAAFAATVYGVNGSSKIPRFSCYAARGSALSPAAVQTDDLLGSFSGRGYNGAAFPNAAAGRFGIYAAETWTSSANGTYCQIELTQPGTTTLSTPAKFTYNGTTLNGGTVTTAVPALSVSQTFNNASTQFSMVALNVTPTLAASESRALDVLVSGTSYFHVDVDQSNWGSAVWEPGGTTHMLFAHGTVLTGRGDSGITFTCGGSSPFRIDANNTEPNVDASYDLGNNTGPLRWRNAWLSGTVKMGGSTASGTVAPTWTNFPGVNTGAQNPYTWLTFVAPDGTAVYVPAFK